METLKRHLPLSGQEGLHELRKIAIKFEEKIYTAATSPSDYLRKISLKMLTMETKSQNSIGNALPSNSAGISPQMQIIMDNNNWRPNPSQGLVVGGGGGSGRVGGGGIGAPGGGGGEAAVDSVDWRSQLQPDSRQRIINKMMETLKRHLPVSGQEGLHELRKIAIRFEEKIYTAATSQSDYLRKISQKMLTMETKSQNPIGNALPSNTAGNNNKSPDAGMGMQPQVHNPGQSLPIPLSANQSCQQMLSQNI
ncbi:mediator of RNA polymerase II transcription subunit 15a [Quercus suber]|uniref:mediator of RNA polymerase II transcription subunit 15a n=1 Tax=Quercus suber TaxID=58331 RepID=UPI0032DE42EA